MRNLILVLGDQLDHTAAVFDDFDPKQDAVWMAEVEQEATHVWCHKQRIALFFAAMRHFRDELREKDVRVHYHQLSPRRSDDRGPDFATVLRNDVKRLKPNRLIVTLPGDFRVQSSLEDEAERLDVSLEVRSDRHFYCTPEEFAEFARGRKTLILETFYRQMRKKHDILMDHGEPIGGEWNFDQDNRQTFGRKGPGRITGPHSFRPDPLTQEVLDLVEQRYADHPGELADFDLPVNHQQARQMLRDFVQRSLANFGEFEDAMWTEEPFLYHSRLSAPLNLKLLNPRDCVDKAIEAYRQEEAPLNSVEGFVRQILGWREFIRGVYWLRMPQYAEMNHFDQQADVPQCFWDGETDLQCVRQSMRHVLRYGYAHHIHRLMVLGNLALLLGVHPYKFHEWHMAMYVDAVDWVSLPNTLGMSQHGDGGLVGTKPYISTGNYIHRMSNFCGQCRYDYKSATGNQACPFTTLYWDFLDRHQTTLRKNHRMGMQMKNLERKRGEELEEIRQQARQVRESLLDGR